MKVLVCPDSFKGSLSASQAAQAIGEGASRASKNIGVIKMPLADGGEGTLDCLLETLNASKIKTQVHDPIMRKIESHFGWKEDSKLAIIEMGKASGFGLLTEEERNPMTTTTYGTGELMKKALDTGCEQMIVALGGSATNDGGAGMLEALGVRFLNKHSRPLEKGGGRLIDLERADFSSLDKRLLTCKIIIAGDVTNPLLGKNGASLVYARQKGADDKAVKSLEESLTHYIRIVEKETGKAVQNQAGAGAAGGLGAGLLLFPHAEMKAGFKLVSEMLDLERAVKNSDIIITGEGKVDGQSAYGKVPQGVGNLAKKYNKPVICLAGAISEGAEKLYDQGVTSIFSITNGPMGLAEAKEKAYELLEEATYNLIKSTCKSSN